MSHGDWKAMMEGVVRNDLELVRAYIRSGIDINFQHPEFMTSALMEAIRCGHYEMLKLLLAHGADPNQPDAFTGELPWQQALRLQQADMIAILEQAGARTGKSITDEPDAC
jgi:uncharacterized protein